MIPMGIFKTRMEIPCILAEETAQDIFIAERERINVNVEPATVGVDRQMGVRVTVANSSLRKCSPW